MAPGGDLFSSMGHTALVFSGGDLEQPIAYDWGAFDASQPALLPRFLAGELEYFLHAQTLDALKRRTDAQGRRAVGQQLRLAPARVQALAHQVEQQNSPELRTYTYHWAEANCATKARDLLDTALGGALRSATDHAVPTTARFEASRHLQPWPVPAFAWRFLVSQTLDLPLTAWERMMVPEHLMNEVAPFAAPTCLLNDGAFDFAPPTPPGPWWWSLPGAMGAVAILLSARARAHRLVAALAFAYGSVLTALGLSSLALWSMSTLAGIGPTENWLVAGPQSVLLLVAAVQTGRRRGLGPISRGLVLLVASIGLAALPMKLLPGFGQANSDILLALLPGLLATSAALIACGTLRTGAAHPPRATPSPPRSGP